MEWSGSGIGSRKHGKSGHVPNEKHFTGTKKKRKRRNSKHRLTKKQRRKKRGIHKNKYKDRA